MGRFAKVVALFSLVVQGCATSAPEREASPGRGEIVALPGKPGLVIAAPHGTSDAGTDSISREVAARTGFGLVLATGFVKVDSEGRRFNVNRPTLGLPGRSSSSEVRSEEARLLYESYLERVKEVARGQVLLLVELHGNARQESASRIEIATVGVSREQAWQLKTLFELIRDAHLSSWPGAPSLQILVEPLDRLYFGATGAKELGALRFPQQALHIELPQVARATWREAYVEILSAFLKEASALLVTRRP